MSTSVSVGVGGQSLVKAAFRDGNSNLVKPVADVVWTTSNAAVATVNSPWDFVRQHFNRAFIIGVSAGTATITATGMNASGGSISSTITVTVYAQGPQTTEIDVQPTH